MNRAIYAFYKQEPFAKISAENKHEAIKKLIINKKIRINLNFRRCDICLHEVKDELNTHIALHSEEEIYKFLVKYLRIKTIHSSHQSSSKSFDLYSLLGINHDEEMMKSKLPIYCLYIRSRKINRYIRSDCVSDIISKFKISTINIHSEIICERNMCKNDRLCHNCIYTRCFICGELLTDEHLSNHDVNSISDDFLLKYYIDVDIVK